MAIGAELERIARRLKKQFDGTVWFVDAAPGLVGDAAGIVVTVESGCEATGRVAVDALDLEIPTRVRALGPVKKLPHGSRRKEH